MSFNDKPESDRENANCQSMGEILTHNKTQTVIDFVKDNRNKIEQWKRYGYNNNSCDIPDVRSDNRSDNRSAELDFDQLSLESKQMKSKY